MLISLQKRERILVSSSSIIIIILFSLQLFSLEPRRVYRVQTVGSAIKEFHSRQIIKYFPSFSFVHIYRKASVRWVVRAWAHHWIKQTWTNWSHNTAWQNFLRIWSVNWDTISWGQAPTASAVLFNRLFAVVTFDFQGISLCVYLKRAIDYWTRIEKMPAAHPSPIEMARRHCWCQQSTSKSTSRLKSNRQRTKLYDD